MEGENSIKMEDLMNGFICLGMLLIFVWTLFMLLCLLLNLKKNLYMH